VRFGELNGYRFLAFAALLAGVCMIPARSAAQAAPGPLPATPSQDAPAASQTKAPAANVPRSKSMAGTWRLNTEDSDDPRKKLQQAHGSGRGGQSGGRPTVAMGGGGWPGGGHGGYGGRGGGESNEDRQKMVAFLQPAQQLTISQKEPEVDVTDDADRKVVLYTDGRKIEKSKDQTNQEMDAKWDEFRLNAEGKDPRGNKYQRSYEVLEGNQQLRETLLLKVGRNKTEISIRYVYDLVQPAKQSPKPGS
jgi:hypothetical protein